MTLLGVPESASCERRRALGVVEGWHTVPVIGVPKGEDYYSTDHAPNVVTPTSHPHTVMILGGGPNRIGQGIELDYCCVLAAFALREMGMESVMGNCNPESRARSRTRG